MDQYEAASFYKVDRYEVQALVEAGELCPTCYEQVGDCEHTEAALAAPSSLDGSL